MTMKPHGLALPTVMVMLSVASLAALLAMRNLWVHDHLLNAEADHLRAEYFAAAVMPLAVQDIVGLPVSGLRHTAGSATQSHAFFPSSISEYELLKQRLGTQTCNAGICAPLTLPSALKPSLWKSQTATAMAVDASASPYGANTAWYWIEIFPQETTHTFIYRITILTTGVLPGSSTVMQALWIRTTATSTTGLWHGWHVLQH